MVAMVVDAWWQRQSEMNRRRVLVGGMVPSWWGHRCRRSSKDGSMVVASDLAGKEKKILMAGIAMEAPDILERGRRVM
ncbi:hypothetical protein Tco_0905943 [Tanacetum coccineum]